MSGKIIEYKVLAGYSLTGTGRKKLASQVNEAIKEGWTPLGGVATEGPNFLQAMVRYEGNLT